MIGAVVGNEPDDLCLAVQDPSCRAPARHPRLDLHQEGKAWMPAFAGMTC